MKLGATAPTVVCDLLGAKGSLEIDVDAVGDRTEVDEDVGQLGTYVAARGLDFETLVCACCLEQLAEGLELMTCLIRSSSDLRGRHEKLVAAPLKLVVHGCHIRVDAQTAQPGLHGREVARWQATEFQQRENSHLFGDPAQLD